MARDSEHLYDVAKLVTEGVEINSVLAKHLYSEFATGIKKDLQILFIEKGDSKTLQSLAYSTFSQPHTQTLEHQILKKSLSIADAAERKIFIENELVKINSSLAEKKITINPISSTLLPGDKVKVEDRVLTVIKKAGEGRRGVVFQVQAASGALYALKTMKNLDPETYASLAQDSAKAKQWQTLKIPYAKVLVQEKEFVLKTWIEGLRGDEVVEKYAAGDQSFKLAAESLLSLVDKIRAQGAYVGDFRPANMIWVGKAWIIIDSGSVQQGMTLAEAQAKWSAVDARDLKFDRRWQMKLPVLVDSSIVKSCQNLFL